MLTAWQRNAAYQLRTVNAVVQSATYQNRTAKSARQAVKPSTHPKVYSTDENTTWNHSSEL